MISFYIKERTAPANTQYVELWIRRENGRKDVFVDSLIKSDFTQDEIDLIFEQEMASLYSTGGVYCTFDGFDDIKQFADKVWKNDYHLTLANLTYGDDRGNYGFYNFYGDIVETHESFCYRIYDINNPVIASAKIGLMLKTQSQ